MSTTPEQLQAWREEFEKTETNPYLEKTALGMYAVTSIENRWQGYLRRCQETEQVMKLAKFGADCINNMPPQVIARVAELHGLMFEGEFEWEVEPTVEATIKEILK